MKTTIMIFLFLFSFSAFAKVKIVELNQKSHKHAYKKVNRYMMNFFNKVTHKKKFKSVGSSFYASRRVFTNVGKKLKPCAVGSTQFKTSCTTRIDRLVRVVDKGVTYYYARVELKNISKTKNEKPVYKNCFILKEQRKGLIMENINPACFAGF